MTHSGDAKTRLRSRQLCLFPSAVMLHEAERHSQSLAAGLPLHKENCEIVGEPPLPDRPNSHTQPAWAAPRVLTPVCPHAQWPPHFAELIYGKGRLGSKAPSENRS